ncbi:MAG: zinc ribbon domain-containing protein [Tenericutes bacterium]|nr:MAG: zinc ribbon domain-containing protein [Mycoplasmatota bacterium]
MPIYEYECESCGSRKEIIVAKQSDLAHLRKVECDKCKGAMKKIISSSNFQLKGGGWYKDGYGNNRQPKKEKPPSEKKGK